MADQARARKLAKRIQEIVATAVEREIKDPRLQYVTVTDCRVTGDLHDATVFYTVRGKTLNDDPDWEEAADALESSKGLLRSIVGRGTGVRFTPTLSFEVDTVPQASAHMEELLERTRRRDAELAEASRGATPSGGDNPYRSEDEDQN